MIRATQPDHMCRGNAVFKRLRLPQGQSVYCCQRSLGGFTHLCVRAISHPFRLSVWDSEDSERGHGNLGVPLHALQHHRVTREIALLSNSSVRSGSELLSKLSFGVSESQGSRTGLLKCSKTGICRVCFTWHRKIRHKLP